MSERHDDENLYVHKYYTIEPITDYEELENKPKINGVELVGNKTAHDLQLPNMNDIPTKTSELTNDSGFITGGALPTKTSDLTNDSGFITSAALPTKTSDLTNDSGFITDAALPTKTSDLTNDSGFITSAALPTKTSDLTNDSGFVAGTSFANLYLLKDYFSSISLNCPVGNMLSQISTELSTVLNSLSNNEYISFEQLTITNLVTLTPENKIMLKKGDVIPTFKLQGFSFGTNEIIFADLNHAKIIHFGIINDRPSADYSDDYTDDITAYPATLYYSRYQKGV